MFPSPKGKEGQNPSDEPQVSSCVARAEKPVEARRGLLLFRFANCNCNYSNLAAQLFSVGGRFFQREFLFLIFRYFFVLCLRVGPFVICALAFNQQFCFVMALNQ